MGASNKNAQDNIQPKGNKKPLQVLHISKKDSQEINNEQNNSQEDIKKENIAIKPQIIKDNSVKEIEDSNEKTKDFDISQKDLTQQDLNRPLNFSEQNKDFQLERTVDEFDFDESAFLEALNANEPIGATGETISGKVKLTEYGNTFVFFFLVNQICNTSNSITASRNFNSIRIKNFYWVFFTIIFFNSN